MPNHIHLLRYIKEQNGKENTAASFTKLTAHQFRKTLWETETLSLYKCEKDDRRHQFWKRDPLAIAVTSETAFFQKLLLPVYKKNPRKLCSYGYTVNDTPKPKKEPAMKIV